MAGCSRAPWGEKGSRNRKTRETYRRVFRKTSRPGLRKSRRVTHTLRVNTEETTDLDLAPEAVDAGETMSGEEILQRMEMIRLRIDVHADEVVAQVNALRDWRSYVRRYPWLSVSAAAAIGFVIVPSRKRGGRNDSPSPTRQRTSVAAAEELRSVLVGAAKKAATAYASTSLGAIVSGFVESSERN